MTAEVRPPAVRLEDDGAGAPMLGRVLGLPGTEDRVHATVDGKSVGPVSGEPGDDVEGSIVALRLWG